MSLPLLLSLLKVLLTLSVVVVVDVFPFSIVHVRGVLCSSFHSHLKKNALEFLLLL